MQWPSEVTSLSRMWVAACLSAGAMSGAATTSTRTASSAQEPPSGSRPLRPATAVPAATARTRTVAMATVRPRARGRGSGAAAPYSSGKL